MKDELKGRQFPLTKSEIKVKKLKKHLEFYEIYSKKLEEKLKKCQEALEELEKDESSVTK